MSAKLKELTKVLEVRGGNHMGDLIWWSLSAQGVTADSVLNDWPTNLPTNHRPERPKRVSAFRRAVRRGNVGLEKDQMLLKMFPEVDDVMRAAVLQLDPDAAEEKLRTRQVGLVKFDKGTETISADDPSNSVCKKLLDLFEKFCNELLVIDIRRMIIAYVNDWDGVSLRDMGGVYWIPPAFANLLRSLATLLESVGSQLYILPIYESAAGKHALAAVAEESLQNQIKAIAEEIDSFDEKTRSTTSARRIEELQRIRSKAQTYASILDMTREGLVKKVAKLERDAAKKMDIAIKRESEKTSK